MPDQEISIKSLKHIIERNGFKDNKALLLARYLIEPREPGKKPVHFSEDLSAT